MRRPGASDKIASGWKGCPATSIIVAYTPFQATSAATGSAAEPTAAAAATKSTRSISAAELAVTDAQPHQRLWIEVHSSCR